MVTPGDRERQGDVVSDVGRSGGGKEVYKNASIEWKRKA